MKNLLISLLVLFCFSDTYAQIGIKANNTAPIPSAQLEVQSTTKAFYPPRMNTAQKNAISGVAAGAMVFDTDLGGLFTYNGSVWVAGSGLTLPYSVNQNEPNFTLLRIENTNVNSINSTIIGATNSNNYTGIFGAAYNTSPIGNSIGTRGYNASTNANGYGVYGNHNGTGVGVYGESNGIAIRGTSTSGIGGYFSTTSGKALQTSGGVTIGGSGVGTLGTGKFLKSINASGDAQWSDLLPYSTTQSISPGGLLNITNNSTGSGYAIKGASSGVYGVGVYGEHSGNASGVPVGSGVEGYSFYGIGVKGSSGSGIGGYFSTTSGKALETNGGVTIGGSGVGTLGANKFLKSINNFGDAQWSDLVPYANSTNLLDVNSLRLTNTNTSNTFPTIYGETNSGNSASAIVGISYNETPTSNTRGITGINFSSNSNGYGVYGNHSGTGSGVYGTSNSGSGVYGNSTTGNGVQGESTSYYGVYGHGGLAGVWGDSPQIGVQGTSSGSGYGGYFYSTNGTGIALLSGSGKVGLGVTPNLNADERVDILGRLRIRGNGSTAGVWFNNAANSIVYTDGAFSGMKNDTEVGLFIGGNWRFWVNNAGNATLTGILTQSSDRRLKKDFSLLNNSLSDIYQLNGYHYKWIEASRSQDLQTGLIAQEVQKIFPELVQTDEKGFLSVNYIGLIPHLIEAAKELKNENVSLKSRLDKIEAMLTNSQLSANSVVNK
jgi:hypothetical protein